MLAARAIFCGAAGWGLQFQSFCPVLRTLTGNLMSIDFEQARFAMVEQQIRPWEVLDPRVLDVLGDVKREDFVPPRHRRLAFTDIALPLEHGEVMMKPVVEGRMLQALDLAPEHEVLEIGTGSGFMTACLATLARAVTSIDIHSDFVERARTRLQASGLGNVRVECADLFSYEPGKQFDAIAVTGSVSVVPSHLRDWLRRHGVPERVVQSAPVRAYYDYFFAYFKGDTNQPSLSAGMGLNHLLRLVAGYKGALFWKLAAGMGDVVFAPMYEVMRRRGVKFEFFHMVEGLELDDAHQAVERVRIARQVAIKGGGAYEPLVDVKGLPCWPSAPPPPSTPPASTARCARRPTPGWASAASCTPPLPGSSEAGSRSGARRHLRCAPCLSTRSLRKCR